jgi:type I restriction enzyme S subunit
MRVPVKEDDRQRRIAGKSLADLFPYYGATQQVGWIDSYIFDEELVLLGEDGAPFFRPEKNVAYVVSGRYWVNNHAHVLRGLGASNRFLCHVLNQTDFHGFVTGTTRHKLTQGRMVDIPVPVPPLPEQRRIVEKVDQLMAVCDALEERQRRRAEKRVRLNQAALHHLTTATDDAELAGHWRRIHDHFGLLYDAPETVAELRQAVLQLAVRGKLVPQDASDEPASVLLERIEAEKQRLFEEGKISKPKSLPPISEDDVPFAVPQGWVWVRMGGLSYKITDGAHKTPTYVPAGVPFISVKDFSGGFLDFSNTRFISPEEHRELYKRCDPKRGDILLGRIGTLGKPVVVDTDQEFSLFVSVGLIRLAGGFISPAFVRDVLDSPHAQCEFDRIKVGGATHTNKLNLGDLQEILIPLPPLPEQRRIVDKVDELMALCDELEAKLTRARTKAEHLASAVVHHLTAA